MKDESRIIALSLPRHGEIERYDGQLPDVGQTPIQSDCCPEVAYHDEKYPQVTSDCLELIIKPDL